jgi:thiol-disulfide isomerase/thioredoxin
MRRSWASAALMTLLVASGASSAAESRATAPERTPLGEFVPAPERSPAPAVPLTEAAGNTANLSDFQGKLVLVNLWATWCEPCLREMPSLERLQARLGERIAILAVSEDRSGSKVVEPFIEKLGLKAVKFYIDPKSAIGHAFEVRGLPTSILIDREGRVLGRVEGAAEWDSPKIIAIIERFLSDDSWVKTSSH